MAQPFPAAVPSHDENAGSSSYGGGSANVVQGGALPPPNASSPPAARSVPSARSSAHHKTGWSAEGGARVALRPGETVDTLARRYGVPAEAIIDANGLSNAHDVAAGQQVIIPTYHHSGQATLASSKRHAGQQSEQRTAMLHAAVPNDRPQAGQVRNADHATDTHRLKAPEPNAGHAAAGSYTVQSGDTLSRIASQTGVSIDALKAVNGLSGSAIRIGQTLSLPAGAASSAKNAPAAPVKKTPTPKVAEHKPEARKIDEEPVKTASAQPQPKSHSTPSKKKESVAEAETQTASIAPKSSGIGKLRWPAKGHVVASFGSRSDGNRDDGIDISVPEGTPVKAAENGVVIYAGNGLKEYGNTVLIRHDDGLVTVYGYTRDIKVKRGDKVTRGQVVADSGMSGAASRPKLHFEVRKDATPVNPMSYLD